MAKEKHFVGMSALVNDDTPGGYTSAGQFVYHGRHKMLRLVEKKWNLLDERFVPKSVVCVGVVWGYDAENSMR